MLRKLPLPVADRFDDGQRARAWQPKRTVVSSVADKQEQPGNETEPEAGHNAHPVEPAEGAREPGEGANEPRPPHPDEPAEGER